MSNINTLSYEAQQLIEAMKGQLLIVLVNRLGGEVDIPASEIDATGDYNLTLKLDPDNRSFNFRTVKKEGRKK